MDAFTGYAVASVALAILGAAASRPWLSVLPLAFAPLVLVGDGISPASAATWMPVVALLLAVAELAGRRVRRRAPR